MNGTNQKEVAKAKKKSGRRVFLILTDRTPIKADSSVEAIVTPQHHRRRAYADLPATTATSATTPKTTVSTRCTQSNARVNAGP